MVGIGNTTKEAQLLTFREAVDARDMDAVEALLSDDVVFRSPVAFTPYPGKAITNAFLRAVVEVFEDFHYVREINDPDGREHAYVFEARVNGLDLTGCDFLTVNEDGKIVEFMVMVRPLKSLNALMERMAQKFPEIQAAAAAWTPSE